MVEPAYDRRIVAVFCIETSMCWQTSVRSMFSNETMIVQVPRTPKSESFDLAKVLL